MWTLRHRTGFISLVIATLVGIGGFPTEGDGHGELRLFDLTTAHGVVDKQPYRPTRVFLPQDSPIYVWFRGEGCTTGTTIRSVWFYLETDPPLRFSEGTVTVERLDNWGQFNFELAPGRQWPLGEYRIELRVGDALMAETRFRVSAVETPRATEVREIRQLSLNSPHMSRFAPGTVPAFLRHREVRASHAVRDHRHRGRHHVDRRIGVRRAHAPDLCDPAARVRQDRQDLQVLLRR